MINAAYIHIWGRLVGAVAWNPATGVADFEYDSSFTKHGWELSPIKMPVGRSGIYAFPELIGSDTFKGLPGLLADILPDKYGNALINTWLTRHGRPTDSLNPVELLCFVGVRGMGALEVEPSVPKAGLESTSIELESLVETAEAIL